MDRRGIVGVVSDVMLRHAILMPLDGEPQLITHKEGGLKQGDEVMFDEVTGGARRKPRNTINKEHKCATICKTNQE